jgi:DNA topoisomerase-2
MESLYQKKTHVEHILLRPDTYVGSTEPITETMTIVDDQGEVHDQATVYPPALYKLFDEILTNASDTRVKKYEGLVPVRRKCTSIDVIADPEANVISITNDGDGIPVVLHKEHGVYIPELLFGTLLTGSNFNDEVKRVSGGRNGYGAKLANIYSTRFTVMTIDEKTKKMYTQTWRDNMTVKEDPVIEEVASGTMPLTRVEFEPDLSRFKIDSFASMMGILRRRCYDIVATTPVPCGKVATKVTFNREEIPIKNFEDFMKLYHGEAPRVYQAVHERWKVGVIFVPDGGFRQHSYVNGVSTYQGGTHVTHVVDQLVKRLSEIVKKKSGVSSSTRPGALLKDCMVVFVDALIENPTFSSQLKSELTLPASKFGSSCEIEEKFIKKLVATGITEHVSTLLKTKESSKTDGKKTDRIRGLPKLEDAECAGTKDSSKCWLILTEGDSAKANAMSGISVVGRKHFGVFPLKGKLLNVREATRKQLEENEEIINLKKILGLRHGKRYTDTSELRYGAGIVIFTDQDTDGSHIKGLLMNFFHYFFPELMQQTNSYIRCLTTPIIKLFKGSTRVREFYNVPDYEKWKESLTHDELRGFRVKYYKGLGTSDSKEAKEYFTDIFKKMISYVWDDATDDSLQLMFAKKRANDRKTLLGGYERNSTLDNLQKEVTYTDFVRKELVHFSNEDNERSIPCIDDGFKPSQRKIFFGARLRGLEKTSIRVAQLSGFVSDKASYHHGEASLNAAIVGMAQDFMGSNNINLLLPEGQFGSRLKSGKDFSAPRYISTRLTEITKHVFNHADDPILEAHCDDGQYVEPHTYLPILPMVLINGTEGIGTGFSTFIPPHNPVDCIANIRRLLEGEEFVEMIPWYRGFTGTILRDESNDKRFFVRGVYRVSAKSRSIDITELPAGESTSGYKEFLEDQLEKKVIESYSDNNTDATVHFKVKFREEVPENCHESLKLIGKISTGNMHLHTSPYKGAKSEIRKYDTIEEIFREWFETRLSAYADRKAYLIRLLGFEVCVLENKARFVREKLSGEILLDNQEIEVFIQSLRDRDYPELPSELDGDDASYDYITTMRVLSLSKTRKEELEAKLRKKVEELERVMGTSEKEMWLQDLETIKL